MSPKSLAKTKTLFFLAKTKEERSNYRHNAETTDLDLEIKLEKGGTINGKGMPCCSVHSVEVATVHVWHLYPNDHNLMVSMQLSHGYFVITTGVMSMANHT